MPSLAIIPARYQSTRLPAKMLARIGDKPLLQWVYERGSLAVDEVVIATDHPDIYQLALSFGAQVVMTSAQHPSGTDRCAEALAQLQAQGKNYDVVINIQGDEPFIQPAQIKQLLALFEQKSINIGTLARKIEDESAVFNPNVVKVAMSQSGKALYFSRHPLPYLRGQAPETWFSQTNYYQHIGLYGFRADVLPQLTRLAPSTLERSESLEQLRWLENDYAIHVAITPYASFGIDTAEDLERAQRDWKHWAAGE